jgi:hypothetical protein
MLDTQEVLEKRRKRADAIDSRLSVATYSTDYNQAFGSAIVNRELVAKAIIYLPTVRKYAANEWLSYTCILRNLQYSKKNGISNFAEILDLCREIVQLHNETRSLEQGLAVVVKSGDKENF